MPLPSNVVDRLVQKVKNNMGRTADSLVSDMVLDWINDVKDRICHRNNFWFQHALSTDTWNQGDLQHSLPTDLKTIDNMFYTVSGVLGYTEIVGMDLEDYRKRYDDVTQGSPEAYLLQETGSVYILRPIPDKTYTISFVYFRILTDYVSGGTGDLLISNYPEILEAGATYRGYQFIEQYEDATYWKNEFEGYYRDLTAMNAERELSDEVVIQARPDVKGTTVGAIKGRWGTISGSGSSNP